MKGINEALSKPQISKFLKIWQIIELIGLAFLLPVVFFGGILFTGDGMTVYDFVTDYILPAMVIFWVIKFVTYRAFIRNKRWPLLFNFIQNMLIALFSLALGIFTVLGYHNDPFGLSTYITFIIQSLVFLALFLFLSKSYYKCLKDPFYQK